MESALVKTTVLLIFLGISVNIYTQNKIEISGYVYDGSSGGKLAGASVSVINNKKGTFTDSAGYFTIISPPGKLHIQFRFIGYKSKELIINAVKDTFFTVPLIQENRLNEITILGKRKEISARSNGMSIIDIPVNQIKKAPALLGETDILKFIQLMPGVQSTGDGNVGLYIRGGNYDQNIISLDGAVLYNPEHLKGFVSAMNVEMIDRITLYKGAFPSIYGSRLSGIVDMEVKEGNYKTYHGSLSLGMLSAKLFFEGPVIKNKTSFAISARRSLYNLIAEQYLKKLYDKPDELTQYSNLSFYDLHAKINHRISLNDNISLNLYKGNDVAGSDGKTTSSQWELYSKYYTASSEYDTENHWGNNVAGLNWKHKFNKKKISNTFLNYTSFKYLLKLSSDLYKKVEKDNENNINKRDTISINITNSTNSYISEIREITTGSDFNFNISDSNILYSGIKFSSQYFNPTVHAYRHTYSLTTEPEIERDSIQNNILGSSSFMNTISIYAEDESDILKCLKVNIGARFNLYSIGSKRFPFIEPRLGIRLLLSENLSAKCAYTYMSQAIHLLSSSNLIMPSDIWVPVSGNISPMSSRQYTLGFFYDLKKKYSISVEGYYKTMNNLLEYRDGVSYITSSAGWESMVASGRGTAFGAELFIQKVTGNTTGSIAFTHSYAFRKFDRRDNIVNFGNRFFAKNDCRNNLSVNFSHTVSKHFDLSAVLIYKTGMRGTLSETILLGRTILEYNSMTYLLSNDFTGYYYYPYNNGINYSSTILTSYNEKNGYKLPDYHRLDLGFNFHIYHRVGKSNISLNLYNLYNHLNISSVYPVYENNHPELKGVCLFPFMPSINYSYEF